MTGLLQQALRALPQVRTGFVVRNDDGSAMTDDQTKYHCYRICRAAGLPEHGWHKLRHTFGTHAAMLGMNPWKLMQWMGHKRIDETMRYVHVAEVHLRPTPERLLQASRDLENPDAKIIAMLGARHACGKKNATTVGEFERITNGRGHLG